MRACKTSQSFNKGDTVILLGPEEGEELPVYWGEEYKRLAGQKATIISCRNIASFSDNKKEIFSVLCYIVQPEKDAYRYYWDSRFMSSFTDIDENAFENVLLGV